jgi:hypothetical protein
MIELGVLELAERLPVDGLSAAAIAEARGELETAANGYAQAVSRRSFGEVIYPAIALVGLGRVLARLGRTAEAAEALNEARPILVKLGAAPLLAETDAMLEQLTALSA